VENETSKKNETLACQRNPNTLDNRMDEWMTAF